MVALKDCSHEIQAETADDPAKSRTRQIHAMSVEHDRSPLNQLQEVSRHGSSGAEEGEGDARAREVDAVDGLVDVLGGDEHSSATSVRV